MIRDLDIYRSANVLVKRYGAISLLIAAMTPRFASALSTFLFIAAVITAAMAIRQSEKLVLEHLTGWDVSAALMALSLLARIFAKA